MTILLKDQWDPNQPGIRRVYTPKGEEYNTLKYVYDRYYRMKDARVGDEAYGMDAMWERWEKQWNAYRPVKDPDDWLSDIYVPITTADIEAQLSEIVEQEFRPTVIERGPEDAAKAKVMDAIVNYTWEKSKSDVALFDMMRDALIYGTAIGQEYYWRQPRVIKDKNGDKQDILEYDDCYLEPVRIWDFYVDERAQGFSGPQAAQDCVRRYVMDIDEFKNFFKGKDWDPLGNASKVKAGGDTNYYEFYHPPERISKDREVEVLWYWNKPQDLLAIVANDVLVVMKPNPYQHKQLPFVRVVNYPKPYQFYGRGECELLASLQEEINTLRRMIIDRNHLDIDKPIFVSDTLTVEDEDTIVRPGGIIPVGDVNSIKFSEYGDLGASVFKSLDLINIDRVELTGVDPRQEAVAIASTATQASIAKEQLLKRINMKVWRMQNDTIIDIGRLRVENIIQFYSLPKLIKITDAKSIAEAEANGTLVQPPDKKGEKYKAQYRNIRLKDQEMTLNDQSGQPQLQETKGNTFFQATPDVFLPSHGGYDIGYKASDPVSISKPLEQQKTDEVYDRLIKNPAFDPYKLGSMLLKSRNKDPEEFKKQEPAQDSKQQGIDLKKIIDLAGMENSDLMAGKKIGPTPYAPVVHTEMHINYMGSDDFKKYASEEVMQNFVNHIGGELMAQHIRDQMGGQGGQPQGAPQPQQPPTGQGATMASSGGEMNASMGDVNPGQQQGGQGMMMGTGQNPPPQGQ